jgi:hypothetical protein
VRASVVSSPPARVSVSEATGIPNERRTPMANNGKKKTTMAKLARENRLRERRLEKEIRKQARKQASADRPSGAADPPPGDSA